MKSTVIKKVMIATDGSINTEKAVITGVEIAKSMEAKLYAIHVVPHIHAPVAKGGGLSKAREEHVISDGEKAIDHVEELAKKAGVDVEKRVLEGNPGKEIIRFAQENDIDLIVMGRLGKSGVSRFLIGGVSDKVVRGSDVEVLIAR
jgi:nucleotide-binding universal stress UspA family protein